MKLELEELMQYNADVELEFQGGTLPANSTLLGLHSSVLRGALEAAGTSTTAADRDKSESKRSRDTCIPVPGTTTEEWLQVAAFMYPVVPPADMNQLVWEQVEVLLKVATRLDIQVVLHKLDAYLLASVNELGAASDDNGAPTNIWKWLRLADKAGLQDCLPLLAAKAAEVDSNSCKGLDSLQDLSPHALKLLVVACASLPRAGSTCKRTCSKCAASRYGTAFGSVNPGFVFCDDVHNRTHTLRWTCNSCNTAAV